ncbi:MAG: pyridoxamine 5-phosphate oxidase [Ignavibacteria bacterium CG22_combo_CG10-13_8_21_14_all_37_15]|nr:MAG: pyridoxamine 5-phosphate oxidase [Ignavibacteria bacterium CG22_combo_CG10-13_8_21_14_all_37_15]
MTELPELVINAWRKRAGPIVFSTVDTKGIPNAIYATGVSIYNPETIVIADNYFDKTRRNILDGSKGSILFLTDEKKSFQVKGSIQYYQKGEIFDDMKKWNSTKSPGHAAAALKVEEVYSGSEKLEITTKV